MSLAGAVTSSQTPYSRRGYVLSPNRLLFRQTSDGESVLDASFSDVTAQQVAEVVRTLVSGQMLKLAAPTPAAPEVDESQVREATVTVEPIEAPAVTAAAARPSLQAPTHEMVPSENTADPWWTRPVNRAQSAPAPSTPSSVAPAPSPTQSQPAPSRSGSWSGRMKGA